MMHCTIEDLVALRDGEGSDWARRHVEDCPACQAEREALYQRVARLKALPARRPARDRWPVIRAEIERARSHHRRRRWLGAGLAAAAAVLGVMVIGPTGHNAVAEELAQAKQQSAQLESALQAYDPDGRVMSGREADLTAQLEDQIARLDGRLTQLDQNSTQQLDLWRQRVDLMQQLVQVRVTRAKYVGL
jgi:anti-sigma factor RsiW